MRSVTLLSVLSLTILSTAVACAPAEEEGNANDQTQDVTGGSGAIESPVVYLFEGADKAAPVKCAGALLSDTMAVTVKGCAKEGMILGRAEDKDGKGTARAQIKKLHTPPQADADIVVVELDKPIAGTHAVITHIPLKDGYAVNGVAAADERGIFSPLSANKGEASSITGKLISETEAYASIVPAKGSTICATDLGAPVCSSTGYKLFNWNITGTCGLSGLVMGPSDAPITTPTTPGSTTTPPATTPTGPNAAPAPAAQTTAPGCNANAWKVVELGRYADFLRTLAPKAFEPVVIDKPILRNFPHAPEGLWGYKSKGTIKTCKIETPKLETTAVNGAAKVSAKVMFTGMEERATAFGRFGIAPKSAPTNMRWLPAKAIAEQQGTNFELTFDGVVSADKDGEYVVAFRASANGGEAWTQCDLDGIENGFQIDKALALKVGSGVAAPGTPDGATPKDAPASPTAPDYSDTPAAPSSDLPSGTGDNSDPSAEEPAAAKKKKTDSGGCSAAPSGTGSAGLPMLGALLGLAAFLRRRRQ